jgi:glutathione synthase/RimK-type ligase-like ATP-grasp enzyme
MRLALATSQVLPHSDPDEPLLLPALHSLEPTWNIELPIWDDPAVDWGRYDAVIIRSTWDYVPKRDAFVAWAQTVSKQVPFWNPSEIIAWNTDKRYLRELESMGLPTVPTQWFSAGETIDFSELLNTWKEIVVKPVVSAGGKDTYRVSANTISQQLPQLESLTQTRDTMVQPYFKSVETDGEFSFLFMNGQFSHAVQKIPKQGGFLIHEHLGGKSALFKPTSDQIAFAENILKRLFASTLYARIDAMIDNDGRLALGELEITEPCMYLAYDAESPIRFAKAIQEQLLLHSKC